MPSESEETREECQDSEDEKNLEAIMRSTVGPPKKSSSVLCGHGLAGAIHHGSVVEGKLACGRPIGAMMFKLADEVHELGNRCKVCEGYGK